MKHLHLALASILAVSFFGCESDLPPPPVEDEVTFEEITPDPRLVHRMAGCWFDNETLVYRPDSVENMCSVRTRGEEIPCSDLCESSAFNVFDMCGSVSSCKALLWVGSENPLEPERGCWNCVDGCFEGLDRTPESFTACHPVEEPLEFPTE